MQNKVLTDVTVDSFCPKKNSKKPNNPIPSSPSYPQTHRALAAPRQSKLSCLWGYEVNRMPA